jgi:hypothetical protein
LNCASNDYRRTDLTIVRRRESGAVRALQG